MANPTTNFGWVMPTSTSLVTNLPADFNTFGQAVDTSMAQLKGGTTGQILSKTSATDMAFTWITNDVGDITGVTAGTGISGGGTSGTVTVTNSMATEITAAGDIIVGTGSGTFDNLPIGTTAQVLTADTTVSPYKVKWATPAAGATLVGCSVWRNSDVTVSNATYTTIGYNQENYDTDGFHDNATNNSRITIPTGKGGKYQIFAVIIFDNSTVGIRNMILNKNGSAVLVNYGGAPSGRNTQTLYTVETLAAGDYLEIQAYQSSGGALTAFFNGTNNYFGVNYIGA